MKLKYWITISMISLLPLLLCTMIMAMISFEWWLAGTGKFAKMFLDGAFNKDFTAYVFSIGILSLAITFTTLAMLRQQANGLDKLEQSLKDLKTEKQKYEAARNDDVSYVNLVKEFIDKKS